MYFRHQNKENVKNCREHYFIRMIINFDQLILKQIIYKRYKLIKMQKQNKQNAPMYSEPDPELQQFQPIHRHSRKSRNQGGNTRIDLYKSAQQLMVTRNKILANNSRVGKINGEAIQHSNYQHRFSDVLKISNHQGIHYGNNGDCDQGWGHFYEDSSQTNQGNQSGYEEALEIKKWKNIMDFKPYKEQREMMLKQGSDQFNIVSTIQMLKRQAELLDMEQNLGTIYKFSTIEHPASTLAQKNLVLQAATKFRKQNVRKIAKGRPQLYNWVKNHKREIAELHSQYKTQVVKNKSAYKAKSKTQLKQISNCMGNNQNRQDKPDKYQSKQSIDASSNQKKSKYDKQNNRDRIFSCNKKTRRLTFLERLKKLEDVKELQPSLINCKRRIRSQNEQNRICLSSLKTLS